MTNPATLLAQGNCDPCSAGNLFSMEVVKAQLLTKILLALNPNAVTDPKTLLAQGNCLMCFAANPFMLEVIEAVLLDSINNNLSGGGGVPAGVISSGNYAGGQPNFVPTSGTGAAIDTSNGHIWWYYAGGWH